MEWKRIYHRAILCLIILLSALNLVFYIRNQQAPVSEEAAISYEMAGYIDGGQEEISDDDEELTIDSVYRTYRELLKEAKELGVLEKGELCDEYRILQEDALALGGNGRWVLGYLGRQMNLQSRYQSVVQSILDSAATKPSVSIFSKGDDQELDPNRVRTLKDFEDALEITWEILPTYALSSVLSASEPVYMVLIFVLLIVWQFGEEQKKGLWGLVYQTPGGRLKLGVKRIGILLGSAVFGTFLFFGEILLWALNRYGGWDIWGQPIQCLEGYYRVPYNLQCGQLLIIHMLFVASGAFLAGLLCWLFLLLSENRHVGLVGVIIILGAEWLLAEKVGEKSSFVLASQMNLFRLLFPYGWMRQYLNLQIGAGVVPRYMVILLFLICCVVFMTALMAIVIVRRKPVQKQGAWAGILVYLEEKKNRILEMLPSVSKEGYKLLFHQKMWIILCIVLWVSFQEYKTSGIVYQNADNSFREHFYEQYTGIKTEETEEYLRALQEQLERQYQEYAQDKDNQTLQNSIRLNETREKFVREQLEYLDELFKEKGISGWIMDERGYETMLGSRNNSSQTILAAVSLFASLMLGAVLFSQEKRQGTVHLLNSTGGRKRLAARKYVVLGFFVCVVWLFTYGVNLYNMYDLYGLHDGGAPVQSLHILEDFPFHVSVRGFVFLLYAMRWLVMFLAACMAAMLSMYFGYFQSIIYSVLLLLPYALTFCGWEQWDALSLVSAAAFQQLWAQYGNSWQLWLRYIIIAFMGGASLFAVGKRRRLDG